MSSSFISTPNGEVLISLALPHVGTVPYPSKLSILANYINRDCNTSKPLTDFFLY